MVNYIIASDTKNKLFTSDKQSLIVVPCWWDGSENRFSFWNIILVLLIIKYSLVATIQTQRPDLLTHHVSAVTAIPTNPPQTFLAGAINSLFSAHFVSNTRQTMLDLLSQLVH